MRGDAGSLRGTRSAPPADVRGVVEAADRLAGHLAAQGLRRASVLRHGCRAGSNPIALLTCSRNGYVCCPPCTATTPRPGGELVDRMRAAALIAQPRYGADGERHDIFDILADRDFLRGPIASAGRGCTVRRFIGTGSRHRPAAMQPDHVPAVHLRHNRRPKGVLHSDNTCSFGADDGPRLAAEGSVLYT